MKQIIWETVQGLFWALLILLTLFVHTTMIADVPVFRYVGF